MPKLTRVLEKKEIESRIKAVAEKISSDYRNRELVLIGVLKGAFIFMADLLRSLDLDVQIDFIGASSYGTESCSSGKILITKDISIDIQNKDVLIVEDIVDTGLTLQFLIEYLKSKAPKTVKICTFIDKMERREGSVEPDYVCHEIKEGFLVGYGLDYAESYRNLPEVYHLNL